MVSQIKVNEIIKQSGSSITIGESGDTIDLSNPSSVTLNSTMKMTPAFFVQKTSDQTVSDNTKTLVTWDDEVYDTDSAFASNKFTVPSGFAGKYNFYIHVTMGTSGSFGVRNPRAYIYKNGTSIYYFQGPNNEQGNDSYSVTGTLSLDLAVDDYIEVYGRNDNDAGTPYFLGKSGDSPNEQRTWWGGYKVLGV